MLGEGLASDRANRLLWVHMRVQGAVRIVKRFTVTSHTTWWLKGAVDQNMELLALGWLGAYSVGSRHAAVLTVGYAALGNWGGFVEIFDIHAAGDEGGNPVRVLQLSNTDLQFAVRNAVFSVDNS